MSERRPIVPAGYHPAPRADGRLDVTITYLEMTQKPERRSAAAPPESLQVSVKLIERPTTAFYRFLYDAVGRHWLWYERKLIPDDEMEQHLHDASNELHVATVEHEPAGFFQFQLVAGDEADLEFFGLRPEFIGLGIGRWLLESAVALAWERAIGRLTVNTNSLDHPWALPLYKNVGFVPVRTEKTVLQDPRVLWPDLYPDIMQPVR